MNTTVTIFLKKKDLKTKSQESSFAEQFKLMVLIKFLESHFFSCTNVSL